MLKISGLCTNMSFLGCVGYLMEKTGLSDDLENVFGYNTVSNRINGNAFTRTRRGHFLMDVVLNILLLVDALEPHMSYLYLTAKYSWRTKKNHLDICDTKIPGRDIKVAEKCILTAKEIFAQLISNPDAMVDEESKRSDIAIQEKLEQEKEKKLDKPYQLSVAAIY